MKLETINKIKITSDEAEVNEYLKKGYVIVKIVQNTKKYEDITELKPVFILGLIN